MYMYIVHMCTCTLYVHARCSEHRVISALPNRPIARHVNTCHHVTYSGYFVISIDAEQYEQNCKEDCYIIHIHLCMFPPLICSKRDENIPTISHVMSCKHWSRNRSIIVDENRHLTHGVTSTVHAEDLEPLSSSLSPSQVDYFQS